ncbi:MAG: hypothetical protein M3459_06245 [Actinomycetota bacterium]|nr:hypothetical protein [Actinomycetota bacterium]
MRRLAALAALAALAGCGGSNEPPPEQPRPARTQDPRALYEQAVMGLDDVGSGTLDADLEARLTFGATQTLTLTEDGAFNGLRGTAFPDYALELTASESSSDDEELTEVVHLGESLFLKPAGADAFQRQTGELVERNAEVYAQETGALPPGRLPLLALTPADWVEDDLRVEGEETVEGRPATRLAGTLALRAFLLDLETAKRNQFGLGLELTQDARRLLDAPASEQDEATIAALVDEEGRLRRLEVALAGDVTPSPTGAGAAEVVGRVEVDLTVALDELGRAQEITAPDAPGA